MSETRALSHDLGSYSTNYTTNTSAVVIFVKFCHQGICILISYDSYPQSRQIFTPRECGCRRLSLCRTSDYRDASDFCKAHEHGMKCIEDSCSRLVIVVYFLLLGCLRSAIPCKWTKTPRYCSIAYCTSVLLIRRMSGGRGRSVQLVTRVLKNRQVVPFSIGSVAALDLRSLQVQEFGDIIRPGHSE